MAGTALTDKFMLGAASVMVGPQASLFDLVPSTHGLGMVKNFQITFEPSSIDLTQGINNTTVMSVVNGGDMRAQMEVYEYTAKNLSYGLGLDGSALTTFAVATTTSGITDGSPTPTATVNVTSAAGLSVNDYILIADTAAGDDVVFARKITAIVSNALTVSPSIAVDIPSGATVTKVNAINAGQPTQGLFLGAKIVGKLANGDMCTILLPKVRIVRGFSVGFQTDQYASMPFELKILDLVSTDTNYAEFNPNRARIYTK
jgi:hypothetical protein